MMRQLCLNAIALLLLAVSATLAGCGSMTGVSGVPFVFVPSAKESVPGVIVLHASGGLENHHIDFARRLSDQGYVTAVVNYEAKGGVDNIDRAYELLIRNPAVRPDRIGLVGFSKGAEQAILYAERSHRFFDRRLGAVVAYYVGSYLPGQTQGFPPILFLHGTEDVHQGTQGILAFCVTQRAWGGICEAKLYDGTRHAFDHHSPEYGGYDAAVTADANRRAVAFVDRHLKGRPAP